MQSKEYAEQVTTCLAEHFTDLKDPTVACVVTEAVRRHHTSPDDAFEVILDLPSANWRLKPSRVRDPWRVRVACYRWSPSPSDHERMRLINTALAKIQ